MIGALRTAQPATKKELFAILKHSDPEAFRTERDVFNTLHHYAGDRPDSSREVLFERTSATRWRLTEEGQRTAGTALALQAPSPSPEQSRVYERGQTVVPKKIRDAMRVEEGTTLLWEIRDGAAQVFAIPKDPVRAAFGILKGKGMTFEQFLADRNAERQRERELEADEERRWRTYSTRRRR